MRATVSTSCQNCGITFAALSDNVRRGWGRFCSLKCSDEAKKLRPSLQQILDQCVANGECLEWLGARLPDGYGRISNNGKQTTTHRTVFELVHGVRLTRADFVRHSCDNPPCCNPKHLLIGTCADNNADMLSRGRQVRGSSHGQAVLTEAMIPDIRAALDAGEAKLAIARRYGVSRYAIRRIAIGEGWRHA